MGDQHIIYKGESMNIGIIILNYLAYEDTIKCVNSFIKLSKNDTDNIKIIIVDNDSQNNSYYILKNKFVNNDLVTVVKTSKNLGFANGNNYGYRTLLKYMLPDFVIISNDDIILNQKNLYNWIVEQYEKYQFGMLGPDIWTPNGKYHQSPCPNAPLSKKFWNDEIKRRKDRVKLLQRLSKLNHIGDIIANLYHFRNEKLYKFKHIIERKEPVQEVTNRLSANETLDYTLMGAFQVFSKKYFNIYSEPYDPSTFLYMEEDFCKLRCMRAKLPMVYSPDYSVTHLNSVATNMTNKSQIKKDLVRIMYEYESATKFMNNL